MASVETVRRLLRELEVRWRLQGRLAKEHAAWVADLAGVPDERLVAAVEGWGGRNCPTLQDVRRELGLSRGKSRGGGREGGGAAEKVDWPPGCAACRDTGLRRVLRHVRDPRDRPVELFSAACNCDLGRARHQHQRVAYLADVVTAWTAAPSTFDGPFIDPGPEHHVAPDRRAEFVARAEARLAETRGVVDHLAAAAAPTRDTRPWFERDGVPA